VHLLLPGQRGDARSVDDPGVAAAKDEIAGREVAEREDTLAFRSGLADCQVAYHRSIRPCKGTRVRTGRHRMFEKQPIVQPGRLWPSAHAASVVALPDGALLASWFAGSREGAPDVAIWAARYEAKAWTEPAVIVDTPGRSDGNSVPWTDGTGALRIWYVTMEGRGWATCAVRERRSSDGGATWSGDVYVQREWGWMVRNEPVLFGQRTIMPMYDERDWSSFVLLSDDGGETWSEGTRLHGGRGIIQPAVAPVGGGLVMLLRSRAGAVYRSTSEDGLDWTAPVATSLENPNSAVELIGLQSGALLAVYNASTRARTPLRVALSDDGGETWPKWRDLETDEGEYSYPTAIEAGGEIHVLYTWRRRTIVHARVDEAWVRG
jgi:predicted neuraminidase